MPTKDGAEQQEPAMHPYELQKLRQCMRNNARLQQLGIPMLASMLNLQSGKSTKKKNTNYEGSESEYDLELDNTGEDDEVDDNTSKNTARASKKITNKRPADMPPGGVKTSFLSDGPHQDAHSAQRDEDGLVDAESEGGKVRCIRGINMGKGLQKMSRARLGKLAIVIPEGKTRPVSPIVAAKFATECNIAVRNHVPIFKHWKEYKPVHLTQFIGKLRAMFDMDINDENVRKACYVMMEKAVRQQRYKLKHDYFDPFPLNMVSKTSPVKSMTTEQWADLVEFWKNPIKMGDTSDEADHNAFDLFKGCHYSKRSKGYTPAAQSVIDEMEQKIAEAADVEEHVSVSEVVADVLAKHSKRNKFLQNVGIQDVQPRTSVQNLQEELAHEKRANAELR
ncbi:hypothetical protein EJB05_23045, partial [Eragrostis curvula]